MAPPPWDAFTPRYLTHMLRFRDAASVTALANFFASGLFRLRKKLGPVLWQFPATFRFEEQGFEDFVRGIGASDCKTMHECLTSPASNPPTSAAAFKSA
mgnify:CR=1 FL=1